MRSFTRRSRSHPSLRLLDTQRFPGSAIAAAEMSPVWVPLKHQAKEVHAVHLNPPFTPVFELELGSSWPGPTSMRKDRCKSSNNLAGAPEGSKLQQLLRMFASKCSVTRQICQQLAAWYAEQAHLPVAQGACAAGEPSQPASNEAAAAAAAAQDIQLLAQHLLAAGFLVQLRDEAPSDKSRDPRSCLQSLRHRFIVCLGHRPAGGPDGGGGGGGGDDSCGLAPEPVYLPEPLVVEPRLREQFAIAHPTPEYQELLQAVPPWFVGPVSRLEAVVQLLCSEMRAAFKAQGLPLPPWRSRQALLSKWAPAQLAQLAAKMELLRDTSTGPVGAYAAVVAPASSHMDLCNGARPAAGYMPARAAVGSAPVGCGGDVHHHAAAAAALQQAPRPQWVPVAAVLPGAGVDQGPVTCLGGGLQAADAPHPGPAAAAPSPALLVVPPAAEAAPIVFAAVAARSPAAGVAGPTGGGGSLAGPPLGSYPPPSEPVLHMLDLNSACDAASSNAGGLKFMRKASAEWKQRVGGNKMKGLLTAAFNKAAAATPHSAPSGSMAEGVVAVAAAAAAAASSAGAAASLARASPNIRRSGDQPWSRITTVRWGAAYVPPAQ